MNIGKQIKQRRLELHLTQEQVAEKIFVSVKSISNWENGKNFPDIESLIRLAKLYELSLDDLLLEGSDIVKDIKEKTELKSLQRGMNIAQSVNFAVIMLNFAATMIWHINWQIQLGLLIVMCLNLINIWWFSGKIRQVTNTTWKENVAKNKIFLILIFLILILTSAGGVAVYFILK